MSLWTSRWCLLATMSTSKRRKYKPMLNAEGVTRAEDLIKPETRESFEDYEKRVAFGYECVASDQAGWEAFCAAFPLPSDKP